MADLLTVADAAKAVGATVGVGEFVDTALVQTYIDAAVAMIEDLSQPVTQANRTVVRDGGRSAVLLPWPFSAVVSIVEGDTTLTTDDYVADGLNGIIYRGTTIGSQLWTYGVRNVTITVAVGVTAIPGNQKLAAMQLFAHLWRTRQGPRPQFNQPGGDVVFTPSGYAVPNAVAELLVATPRFAGFA